MKRLKIFIKQNCPDCAKVRPLIDGLAGREIYIQEYDVETYEGRAEAMFYDIMHTPLLMLTDGQGNELYSWRSTVPSVDDIIGFIGN